LEYRREQLMREMDELDMQRFDMDEMYDDRRPRRY
jgi:hypothetical protein